MQVKKQQLELDMEQTGSKLGKEYVNTVYCHPVYLTYMQSTSCKMPGLMKLKLESRLQGEISTTSDMQILSLGFPDSSVGQEFGCSAGDPGSIPGSGRSAGEGIGYPLQYSWASLVAPLVKNLLAV